MGMCGIPFLFLVVSLISIVSICADNDLRQKMSKSTPSFAVSDSHSVPNVQSGEGNHLSSKMSNTWNLCEQYRASCSP